MALHAHGASARRDHRVAPIATALPLPSTAPADSLSISIDCRYVRERPSGIGAYVRALVDRLPLLDPASHFHLWVDPRAPRPLSPEGNVHESVVRAPANGLATLLAPARLVSLDDIDVLHEPFNLLGRGIRCPTVVTIHDLMWLESPADSEGLSPVTPFKVAFYADGIRRALREATRLAAISHATADVIRRLAPRAAARVRVIPHGIEPRFRPPLDRDLALARSAARLGIHGRYLLVVGQNTPSKNHRMVLDAFAAARLPCDMHLVLLQRLYRGRRFGVFGAPSLAERARDLGIRDRVVFPDHLDDDALVELVQGATALVQFSRYEGFGMPGLEALACGTPVIASNIPALVEVLGTAAVHVPLHGSELARALEHVTRDRGLARELSARGPERAREFSWDRSAQLHLELYREAARAGP